MRRTALILPTTLAVLLAVAAEGQDATRESQIASVEAQIEATTLDLEKLARELERRRVTEDHLRIFKKSLDGYMADLAERQSEVDRTQTIKEEWETKSGWKDRGLWATLGLVADHALDWTGLSFGPRVNATADHDAAVAELRKFRAGLDEKVHEARIKFRNESASETSDAQVGQEGPDPGWTYLRTFAQLEARVKGLGVQLTGMRSRETIVSKQVAAQFKLEELRRLLDRLRHAAVVEIPPPDPDPAPMGPLAHVAAEVIDAQAHGRPEGVGEHERCTWKFKVRLTSQNGVGIRSVKVVPDSLYRLPAELQRRQGPFRDLEARVLHTTRVLGYGYLTVPKSDSYRGEWQIDLQVVDANGNEFVRRVLWYSPGRPPAGEPPTLRGRVLAGRLDPEDLESFLTGNRDRGREFTAHPEGPVRVRVGRDGRASFDTFVERWRYREQGATVETTETFTCVNGLLGEDGKCTGQYRSVQKITRNGQPTNGGGTTDSYWFAEPRKDGAFRFKAGLHPYRLE